MSETSKPARTGAFILIAAGVAAIVLWNVAITFTPATRTIVETHYFTGLLVALGVALLYFRGPARMSATPAGRLTLSGLFAAAILAVDPLLGANAKNVDHGAARFALVAPGLVCFLIWTGSFFVRKESSPLHTSAGVSGEVPKLEAFLTRAANRFQLIVLACLAVPAVVSLSGQPLRSSLWILTAIVALIVAFPALLKLAAQPWGARAISAGICVGIAISVAAGLRNEARMNADIRSTKAALDAGNRDEALQHYNQVLNDVANLHADSSRTEVDHAFAIFYEKRQEYVSAEWHWRRVAEQMKINPEEFPPVQRARCAEGDSLPVWRKLVFEGFPSVITPEMTPGILRLGEIAPDVRAKLLAALVTWEQNAPVEKRREWLNAVQKVAPGEPTSIALLRRMGDKIPEEKMWLPPDLIVGKDIASIEDSGELRTLVCLNAGRYEMFLRAAGTPLHEEWPVVRIELNGQVLGPTQVNKAEDHDVPFTFEVKRGDIFLVRIIFVNHQEDLEAGHFLHRGLRIRGLSFFSKQ